MAEPAATVHDSVVKGNARVRWFAWGAMAVMSLGALWCCRTEVSGGLDEELVAAAGGGEEPADGAPLGTNLAQIGYPYRNFPFVDLMRSADPFRSGTADEWSDGRALSLRDDGYPARLGDGQLARTFLIGGDHPHFSGEVVVLHEGKGRLEYRGGVEGVVRGEGRDVVTLRERDGLWIEILETDPADPLRAIHVLAPGGRCAGGGELCDAECDCVPFEQTFREQPFHPTFLAEHAPFDVIRFMDWMRVNRVRNDEEARPRWPVREWADYPGTEHAQWYPVPVDVMIDLANAADAAPWFTMPHLADDAFVRRFAERVRERLDPGLEVYVEYTNEAWNDLFIQSQEVSAEGCRTLAEDPSGECDDDQDGTLCEYGEWNPTQERCFAYGRRYFAQRTAAIGAIWDEVFGGDERVVTVLGMQVGSVRDWGPQMLEHRWNGQETVAQRVDAVAIAPYFGGGEPPSSADEAFARATLPGGDETYAVLVGEPPDGGPLQWIVRDLHALRDIAPDVELVAYEGGQHFLAIGDEARSPMLAAINRDPRMGELYDEYLGRWVRLTGGSLFVHYGSPSLWSQWGYWGSKEYQGQPVQEAPKHQALLRYLSR